MYLCKYCHCGISVGQLSKTTQLSRISGVSTRLLSNTPDVETYFWINSGKNIHTCGESLAVRRGKCAVCNYKLSEMYISAFAYYGGFDLIGEVIVNTDVLVLNMSVLELNTIVFCCLGIGNMM